MPEDVLSETEYNVVIWVVTSIAVIATVLRLYTRAFVVKRLGWDDALILCGMLIAACMSGLMSWNIHVMIRLYRSLGGTDDPLPFNPIAIFKYSNLMYRSSLISSTFRYAVLPIIKCAILAFYLRITPLKKHEYVINVVGAVMIIQSIIIIIMTIFVFDPPSAWWNYLNTPDVGIRFDIDKVRVVGSGFHVLYDVILLVLPLNIIFKTKLKRRDRVGLLIIYMFSFISLIATIIRLYRITQFSVDDDALEALENRFGYVPWTAIEVMSAILCANFPAMPPLIRHVRGGVAKLSSFLSSVFPTLRTPLPIHTYPYTSSTSSPADVSKASTGNNHSNTATVSSSSSSSPPLAGSHSKYRLASLRALFAESVHSLRNLAGGGSGSTSGTSASKGNLSQGGILGNYDSSFEIQRLPVSFTEVVVEDREEDRFGGLPMGV